MKLMHLSLAAFSLLAVATSASAAHGGTGTFTGSITSNITLEANCTAPAGNFGDAAANFPTIDQGASFPGPVNATTYTVTCGNGTDYTISFSGNANRQLETDDGGDAGEQIAYQLRSGTAATCAASTVVLGAVGGVGFGNTASLTTQTFTHDVCAIITETASSLTKEAGPYTNSVTVTFAY